MRLFGQVSDDDFLFWGSNFSCEKETFTFIHKHFEEWLAFQWMSEWTRKNGKIFQGHDDEKAAIFARHLFIRSASQNAIANICRTFHVSFYLSLTSWLNNFLTLHLHDFRRYDQMYWVTKANELIRNWEKVLACPEITSFDILIQKINEPEEILWSSYFLEWGAYTCMTLFAVSF